MSGVVIRPARDDDSAAVQSLIAPIFAEYEGVYFVLDEMPELRRIASAFEEAGGAFWCAHDDGQLVGCIGLTPTKHDPTRGAELKKLYVAHAARRKGIAQRLVAKVEHAARARGCSYIDLWSDVKFTTAHRFYERAGYQRDGRTRALHDLSDTIEFYFRKELVAPSGDTSR